MRSWGITKFHWKKQWCWERLKAGGEGDDRGWDDWMASLTQWTWVWANSGRQGSLVCCSPWVSKNWTRLCASTTMATSICRMKKWLNEQMNGWILPLFGKPQAEALATDQTYRRWMNFCLFASFNLLPGTQEPLVRTSYFSWVQAENVAWNLAFQSSTPRSESQFCHRSCVPRG